MLTIHALIVCVDYAEFLAVSLPRWRAGVETVTIITAGHDTATAALAQQYHASLYVTDEFYEDGAAFNKGRALESARTWIEELCPMPAWWLLVDADVVPPLDWSTRLGPIRPGSLYGCQRYQAAADALDDRGQAACESDVPGLGYFQLFHRTDPAVQTRPVIETHWTHAGNYDNRLMDRWRSRGIPVQSVGFRLAHIGERENWHGRGKRDAFAAMQAERRRRGGRWDHETIGGPQ